MKKALITGSAGLIGTEATKFFTEKKVSFLFFKLRDNFFCDKVFFTTERISFTEKLTFLLNKYITILTGKNYINYLGNKYWFDNRFTPVVLQMYPKEIDTLSKIVNLNRVKHVLDIGANTGQWAFTLKSFFPKLKITSFEPNPQVFKFLKRNTKNFKNWKAFNLGIGNKKNKFLYVSGRVSSEGSIYKKDSSQKQIRIKLVELNKIGLAKLNLNRIFDLVKIDVEGSEKEVLRSINYIKFRYLYIEVNLKKHAERESYNR